MEYKVDKEEEIEPEVGIFIVQGIKDEVEIKSEKLFLEKEIKEYEMDFAEDYFWPGKKVDSDGKDLRSFCEEKYDVKMEGKDLQKEVMKYDIFVVQGIKIEKEEIKSEKYTFENEIEEEETDFEEEDFWLEEKVNSDENYLCLLSEEINENDLMPRSYVDESNHWTTPWENISTRHKRDVSYEKNDENAQPEMTSEPSPSEFDKRNQAATKDTPIYYQSAKSGVGWWPWSSGLSPVRRSFFVPRLGKRFSAEASGESEEKMPSDTQLLKDLLMKNIYYDDEEGEGENDHDAEDGSLDTLTSNDDDEDTEIQSRDTRAYAFVPRLGKKAYSFSPRLGKKAYSFAPRLGKRAYTFAPRLGKRKFSFSPRLGKRAYSFAPRLGKKAYSFAPRLGKKAYSFAPRLG